MVDFGGLADKAKDLVGDNSDKIKDGITKVGDLVGGKIGHDKVDPVEEKLHGYVDKLSGTNDPADPAQAAAADPATPPAAAEPTPPVTPPVVPPAS